MYARVVYTISRGISNNRIMQIMRNLGFLHDLVLSTSDSLLVIKAKIVVTPTYPTYIDAHSVNSLSRVIILSMESPLLNGVFCPSKCLAGSTEIHQTTVDAIAEIYTVTTYSISYGSCVIFLHPFEAYKVTLL